MIRQYNQGNEENILNKLRKCVRKPLQQDARYLNQSQKYELNRPLRNIGQITKSTLLATNNSQPTTKRDYAGYNYQSKYQNKSIIDIKNEKEQSNVQLRHHSIKKNSIGKENSIINNKNQFLMQLDYRSDAKKNRSVFDKPNFEGISLGNQLIKQAQYKRQRKQFLCEAQTKLNQFEKKLQMVKNQGMNSLSPINKKNVKVFGEQNNQQQDKKPYEELKLKYSNERNSQNYYSDQNYTPRNTNLKHQSLKYHLQNSLNLNKSLKYAANNFTDIPFKPSKNSDNLENYKTQQQVQKKLNKNYNQIKPKVEQFIKQNKSRNQQLSVSKNKPILIQPYQNKRSFLAPHKIQTYSSLNFNNQNSISTGKSNFQTFKSTFQSTTIEGNQKTLLKLKKINDLNDKINQRIRNIIQTFQNKYKHYD